MQKKMSVIATATIQIVQKGSVVSMSDGLKNANGDNADVVQWQNTSFPSWLRESDSPHPLINNMSEIKEGTVKFFNDSKGFGFIIPEEGDEDLFVYRNNINKNEKGLRTLVNNQRVEFEVEEGKKGLIAVNVTPK